MPVKAYERVKLCVPLLFPLSSAQGCAVRTGVLKTGGQCKIKKWLGELNDSLGS
jgi:hypothetical protein